MDCPVCKEAMVVLELQQVEVDYCFGCGGIWLDAGELELLLHKSGGEEDELGPALAQEGKKVKGQKRRCPKCRKRMLQLTVGETPSVTLDRCPRGHGLWLDDGELSELVKSAGGRADLGALADFFGNLLTRPKENDSAEG